MNSRDLRFTQPDILAKLMGFGEELEEQWTAEDLGAIYGHLLSTQLGREFAGAGASWRRVMEVVDVGEGVLRQRFQEVLFGPNPTCGQLELVKRYAKVKWRAREGQLPAEVAIALYFVSIACGVTRCGQRISTLDDATLRRGFAHLLRAGWLDGPSRDVLKEALRSLSVTAH